MTDANEIMPNLWIGNFQTALDADFLKKNNIKLIINVTVDTPMNQPDIDYVHVPIPAEKEDICEDYPKLFNLLADRINEFLNQNEGVLVHCKKGHNRSACIVAAYLIKHANTEYLDAMIYINSLRNCEMIKNNHMTKELYKFSILK